MNSYTYDAYGNTAEPMAHCARCGCPIKYVYDYDGKPYGSTCIEAVSGIHPDNWVLMNGRFDYNTTKLSVAEKEAKRLAADERERQRVARVEAIRASNAEKYADLISVLENQSKYSGDFCSEMASSIKSDPFSTELNKVLRGRAYDIVRDIYAKAVGGRKNSKPYNQALEQFDLKFA